MKDLFRGPAKNHFVCFLRLFTEESKICLCLPCGNSLPMEHMPKYVRSSVCYVLVVTVNHKRLTHSLSLGSAFKFSTCGCVVMAPCLLPLLLRRWAVTVLRLSVSVHLHAPRGPPAFQRGTVLRDRAARGKAHGSWSSGSVPQTPAAGVHPRASAVTAVGWAATGAGTEGLHQHVGDPHPRRPGSSRPSGQQTRLLQLWTCKLRVSDLEPVLSQCCDTMSSKVFELSVYTDCSDNLHFNLLQGSEIFLIWM